MNKKTVQKLLVSVSFTFALALLFLLLSFHRTYQILELKSLDLRFVLQGDRLSQVPVVHIDIDDQSLAKLGRWPWPRNYHAKLVSILKECQARQVLFDVLFMEPQKDNPAQDSAFAQSLSESGATYLPFYFVEDQEVFSPELKGLIAKDINVSARELAGKIKVTEKVLKEKLASLKKQIIDEAVVGYIRQQPDISIEGLLQKIEEDKGWLLFSEDENYIRENFENHKLIRLFVNKFSIHFPIREWPFKMEFRNMNVPIREYIENMKGSGFINADPDIDGVTRSVPLFIRYEDRVFPQITVAALWELLGLQGIEAKKDAIILRGAHYGGKVKDITIPVDSEGGMMVNWLGRWGVSFKHIPYYLILRLQEARDQLQQQLDAAGQPGAQEIQGADYLKKSEAELKAKFTAMVKGKICIVGLTATGSHDLRPVPLQANYPMVGTHSNLINTILTERFIRKKAGALRIFLFFFSALVIAFGSLMKLWKGLLVSIGYALGYFLIALFVFVKFGIWIDLVGPLGIIIFGSSSVTSFRYFTEEKEKLWIKQVFSHYLSKEVINELMTDPSKLKLGGEKRKITVLFSDVRGFTTFSESHQPEEVVAMLNEILTEQVRVVFKYNGTLDKFVGDELMAFFGAPSDVHADNHASVAVRTAVEIQLRMKELDVKWAQEKKEPLRIGIGINTGDMVVGNMGSAEMMDYTVIGDNVNLGARLCSAAGPGEVIISQATYEFVKDQVLADKLEPIMVKGKAKPISIYRVTAMK